MARELTIGELSERSGVSQSALRFYEREGLIEARRTDGNQRRYASGLVFLSVDGPADLVGDNPFAFGRYGGLGAAWLRSRAGQTGLVTVTAEHPVLGRAHVQVNVARAGRQRLD